MRDIASKVDNVDTLSAAEFNSYMSELENAVTKSGITLDPSGGPDTSAVMLAQAVTRAAQGGMSYEDSGAADAYVLTASGGFEAPDAYFDGQLVMFQAGNTNTGASTINVATIGVTDLKDATGTALAADAIVADAYYIAKYNLAGTEFRVVFSGSSVAATSDALLHIRDERSAATNGPTTTGGGTFDTININTVKTNEITGASLSANVITLPAGTYYAEGFVNYYSSTTPGQVLKSRLRNTDDASTELVGQSFHFSDESTVLIPFSGRFTIASEKDFEIQCAMNGITGSAANWGRSVNLGEIEVYADIKIWEV